MRYFNYLYAKQNPSVLKDLKAKMVFQGCSSKHILSTEKCINCVKAKCGRGEAAAAPHLQVQPLPRISTHMNTRVHPVAGLQMQCLPGNGLWVFSTQGALYVCMHTCVYTHTLFTFRSHKQLAQSPWPLWWLPLRPWSFHLFTQICCFFDPWIPGHLPNSPANPA